MTGSVAGIRRRRTVAGRRETPHLPPDRDFYGQTLVTRIAVHRRPDVLLNQEDGPIERLIAPALVQEAGRRNIADYLDFL